MKIVLKSVLLAGVATSMLTATALAADLPDQALAPEPAPVVQASDYDWSGAYVGANLGFGFSSDFNSAGTSPNAGIGFLGGGVLGYNYQINKFVFGVEGDINYTNLDANVGPLQTELDFLGTITARAGYTPIDRLLTYVEGGYAFGRVEAEFGPASDSNLHSGYAVGAGAEYAITDNLITGVEYNYVNLQDQNFNLGAAGTPEADFTGNTVKFNLKYKF